MALLSSNANTNNMVVSKKTVNLSRTPAESIKKLLGAMRSIFKKTNKKLTIKAPVAAEQTAVLHSTCMTEEEFQNWQNEQAESMSPLQH